MSQTVAQQKDDAVDAEANPQVLIATEDQYGGVEVKVPENVTGDAVVAFSAELQSSLASWEEAGKGGIWLTIPLSSASCVGAAAAQGFEYHHAKPDYALLTRWLPKDKPSPLPKYGFTQVGVGGVVVNHKDEVLMVQEKVSPLPMFQGSWKLPGGLADPGEDFADTVAREVLEETGITTSLIGVVSLRHSHGFRFGQGDIYVLVKLRATNEDIKMDPNELIGAEWMSRDHIQSLVAAQGEQLNGKVSPNNWKMIDNALTGSLIQGEVIPNSRAPQLKGSMLYTAPQPNL